MNLMGRVGSGQDAFKKVRAEPGHPDKIRLVYHSENRSDPSKAHIKIA